MINVSSAWHRALAADKRDFLERVTITLKSGTVLNLTNENIWSGGFSIDDAVSADSDFQIGAAIVNKFNLTINNIYGNYDDYDFTDAKIRVRVGLVTDSSTEIIDKGTFIVNTATYNGALISLVCYDYMSKFDKPYKQSGLTFPATLDEIVRFACQKCQLSGGLATLNFPHKDFEIATSPDEGSITYREMIAWCAQIAGCFARINTNGALELKWYDRSALEAFSSGIDGGEFDQTSQSSYQTGDTADGGTFNPWNEGTAYDGGTFPINYGLHFISSVYSRDVSVDDVVITGVSLTYKSDGDASGVTTSLYGNPGYVVSIENNPLINATNEAVIGTWLANQLVGFTFRKANISHGSDPSIEAGDVAVIFDNYGRQYPIVVSRTVFTYGSSQTTVSSAQTPARNSAERFSVESKNYVTLHREIDREKTARELVEEQIREELANSNGLYYTAQPDPNDATKTFYYLHNKQNLNESAIRIWFSDAGIMVTSNGTATTPTWYGLTVSGTMLTNLLSTTGLNADWINAGHISAARIQGGSLTLGGLNNTNGVLRCLNSDGERYALLNLNGFYIGNIANDVSAPEFLVTKDGAVTAKSFTANDYIYVNGNSNSYFYIPNGGGYTKMSRNGFEILSADGIYTKISNSFYTEYTPPPDWAEIPDEQLDEYASHFHLQGYYGENVAIRMSKNNSNTPGSYVALGMNYVEVAYGVSTNSYALIRMDGQNRMFVAQSGKGHQLRFGYSGFSVKESPANGNGTTVNAYTGQITIGSRTFYAVGGILFPTSADPRPTT